MSSADIYLFFFSHFEYFSQSTEWKRTIRKCVIVVVVVVIFFISISCHDQINRRETREIILQSILFCRSYRIRNRFLLYRSFLSIPWIDNIFRYKISSYVRSLENRRKKRREENKEKRNQFYSIKQTSNILWNWTKVFMRLYEFFSNEI